MQGNNKLFDNLYNISLGDVAIFSNTGVALAIFFYVSLNDLQVTKALTKYL